MRIVQGAALTEQQALEHQRAMEDMAAQRTIEEIQQHQTLQAVDLSSADLQTHHPLAVNEISITLHEVPQPVHHIVTAVVQ